MPATLEKTQRQRVDFRDLTVCVADDIHNLNQPKDINVNVLSDLIPWSVRINPNKTGANETIFYNISQLGIPGVIAQNLSSSDVSAKVYVAPSKECCLTCNKTYDIGTFKDPELRCREHLLLKERPGNEKCKEYGSKIVEIVGVK